MAKDSDPVMITRRSAERASEMLDWFDSFAEDRRLRQAARRQRGDYPWLYEVTAVDTGAGTCTVQRRTSGDSSDGREVPTIEYVEYDADNEPSVGDIGELCRLGNGALFVFRAGSAAMSPFIFAFGREGTVITSGAEVFLRSPFSATLSSWSLLADPAGSITIDIWKDTFGNFPPTDTESITNGHEPSLSSNDAAEDNTVGDWSSTSISDGDCIIAHVDSCSTIERAWLMLEVE